MMKDDIWDYAPDVNIAPSLKFSQSFLDSYMQIENWQGVGDIYYARGDLDTALNYYQKSVEKDWSVWGIHNSCRKIAFIFYKKDQITKSIDFLITSTEKYEDTLIQEKNSIDLLLIIALKLSVKHNFYEIAFRCIEKFKDMFYVQKSTPLIAKCKGFEIIMKTIGRERFIEILSELAKIYEMEDENFDSRYEGWQMEAYRPKDYYEPLILSLKINLERLDKGEPSHGWSDSKDFTMLHIIQLTRGAKDYESALNYCRKYQEYAKKMNEESSIEDSVKEFIKIYEAKGDYINVAEQYVLLAAQTGDEYHLIDAINAYEKCGNFTEAGEKCALIADRAIRVVEKEYRRDINSEYRESNIKKFKEEAEKYLKKAALFFQKSKEWKRAAEMYEKADMPEKAAEIYAEMDTANNVPPEQTIIITRCPNPDCKEEIKPHWIRCPVCGIDLKGKKCACGEELKSHWNQCPACGKKLK